MHSEKRIINYQDWIRIIKILSHVNSHFTNGESEKMWRSCIHQVTKRLVSKPAWSLSSALSVGLGGLLNINSETYICIYIYIYTFIICDGLCHLRIRRASNYSVLTYVQRYVGSATCLISFSPPNAPMKEVLLHSPVRDKEFEGQRR